MNQRLSVSDLFRLLTLLDERLADEGAHPDVCESEWSATLLAAGYTPQEYETLVDKHRGNKSTFKKLSVNVLN